MPVRFDTNDQSYDGSITDISTGGAFIELDSKIEKGSVISLRLDCLSFSEPFRLKGRVTARRGDGIGVEFEGLSENQRNMLSYLYW